MFFGQSRCLIGWEDVETFQFDQTVLKNNYSVVVQSDQTVVSSISCLCGQKIFSWIFTGLGCVVRSYNFPERTQT